MAVRLRLRRMGKKKQPFYRIVAIDSRVKRDGKYLENLGTYNPIKDPTELTLNAERALHWLGVGAQPSDTVRTLLRRTGVMLRFDLIKRGKSEAEIEEEVKKWTLLQEDRQKRLDAGEAQKAKAEANKAAEKEAAEEKAEAKAEAQAKAEESAKAEVEVAETAPEEPVAEKPAAEEPVVEAESEVSDEPKPDKKPAEKSAE
ncbi:MAG: 30S ribosomal protein S16 [Calditrichaeota bacterium]|nr:MAG: 30S ribosomal protein S16 [Calditrichota bacterium]